MKTIMRTTCVVNPRCAEVLNYRDTLMIQGLWECRIWLFGNKPDCLPYYEFWTDIDDIQRLFPPGMLPPVEGD